MLEMSQVAGLALTGLGTIVLVLGLSLFFGFVR